MRISITQNDIEEHSEPGFTQKLEKITKWERKNGHLSLFQSDGFSPKPKNKDKKGHSKRNRTVFNEMLRELKEVKRKLEEIFIAILEDTLFNPFEMFFRDSENFERRFDHSRVEMAAKEISKFIISKESAENNFDIHLVFDTEQSSVVYFIINKEYEDNRFIGKSD